MALPLIGGIAAKIGGATLGGIAKSLGSMLFGSKLKTGLTMFGIGNMMGSNSMAGGSAAAAQLGAYRGY